MSITFTQPPYLQISFRTFDRLGTDGNPCGSFSYYAKADAALSTGLYVELYVASCWDNRPSNDFMGDKFEVVPWTKATFEQREIWLKRVQQEYNKKLRSTK